MNANKYEDQLFSRIMNWKASGSLNGWDTPKKSFIFNEKCGNRMWRIQF
jgi:hypothetical protein